MTSMPRLRQRGEEGHPVVKYRLTETLLPGQFAAAKVVHWSTAQGKWVDTTWQNDIYDSHDEYPSGSGTPYGVNFGLSGEIFEARFNPFTRRHEVIGSRGLHRFGVADGAISAGSAGVVSVYHSPSSASCSGSDSGVNVTACAKTDVSASDELFLEYHPELKQWFIITAQAASITASTIIRVEATAFFEPGDSQSMNHWTYDGASWSDSGNNVTVQNTNKDACLLSGEFGWAIKIDDDPTYELLPVGTVRHAALLADIDVGGAGSARMLSHSAGDCSGVSQSSHDVTVCNGGSNTTGFRKLFTTEKVWIRHQENKWLITSVERILLFGKPTGSVHMGALGAFNLYRMNGGSAVAWGSNQVDARNISGITFDSSKLYAIRYFANSDEAVAFPEEIRACQ